MNLLALIKTLPEEKLKIFSEHQNTNSGQFLISPLETNRRPSSNFFKG
jgi:hypothetical protein